MASPPTSSSPFYRALKERPFPEARLREARQFLFRRAKEIMETEQSEVALKNRIRDAVHYHYKLVTGAEDPVPVLERDTFTTVAFIAHIRDTRDPDMAAEIRHSDVDKLYSLDNFELLVYSANSAFDIEVQKMAVTYLILSARFSDVANTVDIARVTSGFAERELHICSCLETLALDQQLSEFFLGGLDAEAATFLSRLMLRNSNDPEAVINMVNMLLQMELPIEIPELGVRSDQVLNRLMDFLESIGQTDLLNRIIETGLERTLGG